MTTPEIHKLFLQSAGVSTDTRSIAKNTIFFALKGGNFNANEFADQALESGAAYAVIDDDEYAGERKILVDEVLRCLQDLALYHRRQLSIPIISLTGSNGKTTSKELMAAVLSTSFRTAFTKGNLNNHIGVPLTLLSISAEHEMAIVEMGANHQQEIAFLCSLSEPDYGYITNFGKAHLEGFGGVEGVIKGKSELYDFLRSKPDRKVFTNLDDPIQVSKSKGIETISFGSNKAAQHPVQLIDDGQPMVAVEFNGIVVQSQLMGNYNFSNIAAAICIGKYFGVDPRAIKEAIESYSPTNNRSQLSHTDRNKLVIDTYNANPSSVEAALRNFGRFSEVQKWVILGDMFEMGEWSAAEHQRIADLAGELGFEKVLLAGHDFHAARTGTGVLTFATTDDLLQYLIETKPSGKTILIKGSRGMKMERAIPLL